jgi:protein subunit release factor B
MLCVELTIKRAHGRVPHKSHRMSEIYRKMLYARLKEASQQVSQKERNIVECEKENISWKSSSEWSGFFFQFNLS